MALASKYDGKCKDCGTTYVVGEMIDTNGKQSPNQAGQMKDHWCKMGKNCQGAMQLQGNASPTHVYRLPPLPTEPSTSELRANLAEVTKNMDPEKIPEQYQIIDKMLLVREACENIGMKNVQAQGLAFKAYMWSINS